MSKIDCYLIRDLLPLVVDGITSEETTKAVQEHLECCASCKKEYEQLQQELVLPQNTDIRCESAKALQAIKYHLRWKRIALAVSSVLVTVVLVISGYLVFQNVGVVHDFFDPMIHASIRSNDTTDWQEVKWDITPTGSDTTDTLQIDSMFYQKNMVSDANSDAPILLRVRNTDGSMVLDAVEIQPGESVSLKELKRNTEYRIEIKTTGKDIFLNFC